MFIHEHLAGCGVSAGAGGAFGLVGHLAARTADYIESKRDFAAKQAERAHELELLRLRLQGCWPGTEAQSALVESRAAPRLSPGNRSASPYGWVEAARALVRPILTLGLSAVLAAAFFSMTPDDASRALVTDSLVFACVTAIVWWFGDRTSQRK